MVGWWDVSVDRGAANEDRSRLCVGIYLIILTVGL